MEKIRLGKTNMMVSKLGFGGVPIQRLTENEAVGVVRRCVELGVNFLDTANSYTTSGDKRFVFAPNQNANELLINGLLADTLRRLFSDATFLAFIS